MTHYVGIIAEYNPFHSGHRHQIQQTKNLLSPDTTVIAVISGNWTQQARCAIFDKWTRTRLALEGGVDLVLELPTPWATASAQPFARGGVALLQATGLVTHLSFGSEAGSLAPLLAVSQWLHHPDFPALLQEKLTAGVSFATARQQAVTTLSGEENHILSTPNNTLALEYLSALYHYNSTITPLTIPRAGGGYHSRIAPQETPPPFTSATHLRETIQAEHWEGLAPYLSPLGISLGQQRELPQLSLCERGLLAKLATMTLEDWCALPDSGAEEGLPHRLIRSARSAHNLEEFLTTAKTKRYTHARLRRLVLWVFLGLTAEKRPQQPPYLRVLGCNAKGQQALHQMKKTATLPLFTKPAHVRRLPLHCQELFQQESIYTDLYGLCFPTVSPRGEEWRQNPIVL